MHKFIFVLTLLFSCQGFANDKGGGFFSFGKVQGAENDRWTLADWLEQKKKFRFMDHWLSMNTKKKWIWLSLNGGSGEFENESDSSQSIYETEHYGASFWVTLFGLEFNYQLSDEDTKLRTYLGGLRLFGSSARSTQLVLLAGERKWEINSDTVNNKLTSTVWGGRMEIYLSSVLGIRGEYLQMLDNKDQLLRDVEGVYSKFGVFADFGILRLYAHALNEDLNINNAGVQEDESHYGHEFGLGIYL